MSSLEAKRFGQHDNSLGFLRLILASMVILSHTPELFDGDRHREILSRVFGTISFGEFAVDGFFLISGYLIVSSYLNTQDAGRYLLKRAARIYPGFFAAFLLAVFVEAPLGGASLPHTARTLLTALAQAALLQPPDVGLAFDGSAYPVLNGSAWTIAYEFRCYLLVAALGSLGWLAYRHFVLVAAVLGLVAAAILQLPPHAYAPHPHAMPDLLNGRIWTYMLAGDLFETLRLTSLFLVGACFYLFRDQITFERRATWLAALGLCAGLFLMRGAHAAVAMFGGYLLFAVGCLGAPYLTARINNREDISYGVYLYAWPITKLIQRYAPDIPLVGALIGVYVSALACGWLSWRFVEKPALALFRGRAARAEGARAQKTALA